MPTSDIILLDHGSGGELSQQLIEQVFLPAFGTASNSFLTDAATITPSTEHQAVTTDSFVVKPLFFPGGDIGKLAVCGTLNDLTVSGAKPLYLTASFILEEGLPIDDLRRIAESMATEAKTQKIPIIAGDTKVVERGSGDGCFITTTGIGSITSKHLGISHAEQLAPGDEIILSGTIADHGMALLSARENLPLVSHLESDCAALQPLISELFASHINIKFMRDPTRGGLATVLCELAQGKQVGINLVEEQIPLREDVRGLCELLGFDPLYVANEGKVVIVVSPEDLQRALTIMHDHPLGQNAGHIGTINDEHPLRVVLQTAIGGSRIVDKLTGAQLPRIC